MKAFLLNFVCCAVVLGTIVLSPSGSDAAQPSPLVSDRVKAWKNVKAITVGDYLPIPQVHLPLVAMKKDEMPRELFADADFPQFEKILELQATENFDKAYIEADNFINKHTASNLSEWAHILKADLLFQVQETKKEKRYNLPLEEYQDALRRFPINTQNQRMLYQIALLQLKMELFTEVNSTTSRALGEHPNSEYGPLYRLVDAEQAFQSKDDLKANFDFSMIIQKYPKHLAAVDSAFRKAFILFRKGDYKSALRVYEDLDKFHSEEMSRLKMKVDAGSADKFVDRVYYAETVYLNEKYSEAAKLFQDLANLFPSNPAAPLLFLRLADTYFWRGQTRAAEELYLDVLGKYKKNPTAQAAGKIRIADLHFITGRVESVEKDERLYSEAYEIGKKSDQTNLAALALARLAAHHIYFKTYPKAQEVLAFYRSNFKDTANQVWVEEQFTRTVELEILDYYNHDDYLAALTTYLMFERFQANHFQNTRALLKIADAAGRLGLHEKASQILNRVVYLEKTSEGRQEALLGLVEILIQQGELRKASERLRRFSFAYPKTPLNYLYEKYWGELYSALKNDEQSIQHYEKALEAAHNDPSKIFELRYVYMRLAEVYERQKLPLKQIDAYEKFAKIIRDIKANPLSTYDLTKKDLFLLKFSRYRIADSYFNMRDYVKALEAYRAVTAEIKEEPFLSHSFYRIGECYLALEDRKAALAAFKQIPNSATSIWSKAAQSYIASVQMEGKYGIRIFN